MLVPETKGPDISVWAQRSRLGLHPLQYVGHRFEHTSVFLVQLFSQTLVKLPDHSYDVPKLLAVSSEPLRGILLSHVLLATITFAGMCKCYPAHS